MSFSGYSDYRDSHITWLGKLPSHWDVVPLKAGFDLQKRPPPMEGGVVTAFRNGQVTLRSNRRVDGFTEALQEIGYQGVEPNDLVIHAMDAFAGAIGVSDSLGKSTPVYSVCKPKTGFYSKYYGLVLRHIALAGYIQSLAKGIRERSTDFRWADAKNVPVPCPPEHEQVTILKFLDHETAKIDALIAEQEKLIELLKEKRQAVISHAVTKGLDPNVKMKDSGVEWLGEIPEHWEVKALKHIVSTPVTDGPHETPEFLDEGVPFVSAEAVSAGTLDFKKIRGYISRENHEKYSLKYVPKRDDIFMIKSGATTGACAIVDTDDEFNIWSPLAAIRCKQEIAPYFILNYMRSRNFQEAVTLNWSFGTQQNIGMSVIENLRVVIPPILEQSKIASFLSLFSRSSDKLTQQVFEAINILIERRSALISAAVTGQIDVRDFKTESQAA
jgi:type I restriction enzyme S subunit